MRFRPSPALVLAALALLLAAGGGAFAAVRSTGSAVNIVDKSTAANVAKVTSGGSLQISGAVTATPTSASNYLEGNVFGLTSSRGCMPVLAPPSGKAMIVTDLEVDTFNDPTPGPSNNVMVFVGACTQAVADVNPASVGGTPISLGAGVAIPAGSELSAFADGGVQAEVYAYGYSVSASSVPSIAEFGPGGLPPQH
jgi:hypothetical protein